MNDEGLVIGYVGTRPRATCLLAFLYDVEVALTRDPDSARCYQCHPPTAIVPVKRIDLS